MPAKKKTVKSTVARGKGTAKKKKGAVKRDATQKKAATKKSVSGKRASSGKKKISPVDEKTIKKRLLLEYKEKILTEAREEIAKYVKGEKKQMVETALDDGDLSQIDQSEDINLRTLASHKETLNKIEDALRKLDEGTYGLCDDCGAEISEARLAIIPFAVFCVECKENREKLEEFSRGL